MKIRRIAIHNYRGIEERNIDVPTSGAIARGRNGAGKSTILRAIKAALLAQDVKADAIRQGADRAEILVDLGDVTVKRVITANTSTVTVEQGDFEVKKPQTYLTTLLGTSSLDPMDLLLLKGKERQQKVLDALPVTVTVEQLRTWWPKCPDGFDCSGHGLQVIARVRKSAYDKRTDVNRQVKEAKAEAERLAQEASRLAELAPAGEPDVDGLVAASEAAKTSLAGLRARQEQASNQTKKTEAQRAKVNTLRAKAIATRDGIERAPQAELDDLNARIAGLEDRISELRAELARLEAEDRELVAQADVLTSRNALAAEQESHAAELERQADELESALAEAAIEPVSAEELDMARRGEEQTRTDLESARKAKEAFVRASQAQAAAEKAREYHEHVKSEADRLDGIVKALTDDAPAALLASCDGIPGLTLDGEEVLYNGIRLDTLCGAEQVRVCVEIARRLNAKSKVLVVDGLERLDPEQLEVFVQEATRDGYQLIATRVDRGDIVIEAIEPDPVSAEAAE